MAMQDELGARMKTFYEGVSKTSLMRRVPVAVRIDGKAFHTFTRGFAKPFDEVLIASMQDTMKYLCENIQGCVLGYTQSDEITLILVDYQKLNSDAFFDYEVQKICSVSASMATMAFNKAFALHVKEFEKQSLDGDKATMEDAGKLLQVYGKAVEKGATFDARCFNIPKEEVTNLVYWRQLDAARNSVQMVGHANFSQKELKGKSCNEIQDMLMLQKSINWNDFPVVQKRGSCCRKEKYFLETAKGEETVLVERSRWIVDKNIPIFRGEDREYIDKLVYVGEK